MRSVTRFYRRHLLQARAFAERVIVGRFDPQAYQFYAAMIARGYSPAAHIDVLPQQRMIYVCVPKAASSRIKMSLSAFLGRNLSSSEEANKRRLSGLKAPHHVGLSKFYRLVTDANTLRFSFVRNPYARLVSCWADKFQGKPLIPGDAFVDTYLAERARLDLPLPSGAEETLSFADFVRFAEATVSQRGVNAHWQRQQELVDWPGIPLDFIGRVESFERDFARVLDHVGADEGLRSRLRKPVNVSSRRPWQDYYTAELAAAVYRAYESDFDRFGYPRALTR